VADILALTPGFNLSAAAAQSVYVQEADRVRLIDGLREAGLPE
jgi:hypothetical protein